MRKLLIRYYLLIPLLLSLSNLPAQSFIIQPYTTANGLPDNVIYGVTQDKEGYLWIATGNGVSRYDGTVFKNYGLSGGLPSLNVNGIYQDSLQRLWIYTRSGIARVKNDSCIISPLTALSGFSFVNQISELYKHEFLALTNNGVYNYKNESWNKINLIPGYEHRTLVSINRNKEGLILDYDNRDLLQLDNAGQYKILSSHNIAVPFFNSVRQKGDTVFTGTYHGIFRIDNGKLISLFEDSLAKRYVYGFYIDSRNRFWVSTKEDGILLIIPGKEKTVYRKIPVSFNLVYNFFEDRDRNIWVSCLNGLLRISDAAYQTFVYPGFHELGDIRNIISLPGNELLLSGSSGELMVLKNEDAGNPPVPVRTFNMNPNDFIDYFSFDEEQRLWCCTRESKLYRFDKKGITDFSSLIKINQAIRTVYYDIPGRKLYVSVDSVLMSGDEKHLDTLKEPGTGRFISLPADMARIPGGTLIVSTLHDGIIEIGQDGKFSPAGNSMKIPEHSVISRLQQDPSGKVWLSIPGYSLLQYHREANGNMVIGDHVNRENGMQDDVISEYLIDKFSHIWMISKRAVIMMQQYQPGSWQQRVFETGEDLKQTELFFSKLATDNQGNVWVSARDKILRFSSGETASPEIIPSMIIEKVLLFNKPTDWSLRKNEVTTYRELPVDPVLNYNENTLNIYFKGIEFTAGTEYSYRLLPSDSNWNEPGMNTSVALYQLAPGKYHFMVRARQKGGNWSQPADFSFTIKKPFWENWWFRLLVILFASGAIVALFRYRLQQLKNKSAMNQQLRELEMKALKAQMNPHFIHNALNSIQSLILNNQSSEASHYISKFARLLRQVLENTDMNLIPLEKELSCLQLYADLEQFRMNMEVVYRTEIDPELSASQVKIPPFILQPFVENALWHGLSRKEGDKNISLRIYPEGIFIICEITDNGIGRKKAAESYQNFPEGHLAKALTITRQRIIDFNRSAVPEPIVFIDLENDGNPAGTRVILRLRKQD